ncbi:MAG: hypothetical protein IJI78_02635 [Oscillospiraceae bacterium]|nr:hypothetical protein [Oscillospiraceae bacterium]
MDLEGKREISDILRALEDGLRDFMDGDAYRRYLTSIGRFHDYSNSNIMLINAQRPDATLVAGYSTWKMFNRHVKRGEHGIRIIAPIPVKVEREKVFTDEFGKSVRQTVEKTVPRFRTVTVFDISQTDGEPLPEIAPGELAQTVKDYGNFLKALHRSSRVAVEYEDIEGGAKGYYELDADRIVIQKGMGEAQTVKTLVHEIAHSFLHDRSSGRNRVEKSTKEVEAESVAYAVCSRFGIDTSDYTFPYVSAWSQDKDLKTLKESMERIRDTSSHIIHLIERNYEEICRENEIPQLAEELAAVQMENTGWFLIDQVKDSRQRKQMLEVVLKKGDVQGILDRLEIFSEAEKNDGRRDVLSKLSHKVSSYLKEDKPKITEKGEIER